MDKYLFEYEMKKAGYTTPAMMAKAIGLSLSAYYRRFKNTNKWTKEDIDKVAVLLGWEAANRIFFANQVS